MEVKNKVAIFVDYENLFYSMYNKFQTQPDPMEFIRIARRYGQIVTARAYGDFEKNPYIKNEVPKLRAASFEVVHTRTEMVGKKEKSYTDFKIVEDLFVFKEENRDVENIILATGDGHFSNIVARLRIRDGKKVLVVGVKGSISRELQMASGRDDVIEISGIGYEVDVEDLKRFLLMQEERYRYLTFIKTAQAYLEKMGTPPEYGDCCLKKVISAMNRLIDEGYLEQVRILRNDVPINIIRVAGQKNMEKLG
ncbi:MAG: NYN domain-containing protein [Peptococcaceae bacterium]|nr:NYN domain-containing protein [Peptococcaceae bacterium]